MFLTVEYFTDMKNLQRKALITEEKKFFNTSKKTFVTLTKSFLPKIL